MQFEVIFVTLFSAATAVGLLARWLQIPYTVALVVAGLILGAVGAIEPPHLTKELLFSVFLPGLVFEAAFHLDFEKFWENKVSINVLATPGMGVAIVLTAAVLQSVATGLHITAGFELRHALVFAALISATDPISVVALFKSLHAPRRLAMLIEAESLLNDGTAVVFFTLVLQLFHGRDASVSAAFLDFVLVVGMGTVFGVAIGYAISQVARRVEDPMIQITLTTIAAYGAFTAAEHFHFSGIIATMAAGMICGNYGARYGMSPSSRIAVQSFWEYVSFALNSIVFLLIGFEVRVQSLLRAWKPILIAYLAVTIGRAAVVYLVSFCLRRTREAMPWSWNLVLTWGGLRGGLSMVLALALPKDFPFRELLLPMTFGVVVLSILIQGLSMAPLLRRLQLVGSRNGGLDYEPKRSRA
jgi:CPA1 family monovalent cation:H+ antiporter